MPHVSLTIPAPGPDWLALLAAADALAAQVDEYERLHGRAGVRLDALKCASGPLVLALVPRDPSDAEACERIAALLRGAKEGQ